MKKKIKTRKKGKKVRVNCRRCGKFFWQYYCHWKVRPFNYCSLECRYNDCEGYTIDGAGHMRIRLARGVWAQKARWLMRQHLGRDLLFTEQVHHKNGDKLDDRIENLEILDIREHGSLHGKQARGIPKYSLRKSPIYYLCPVCNKKFKIKSAQYSQIFCSRECYWSARLGVTPQKGISYGFSQRA